MKVNIPLSRDEKKDYELEMIVKLIEENEGMVKTSDIEKLGVDYRRVLSFVEDGSLIRVKSGYYSSKYFQCSEEKWIKKLFPDGILTMESALYAYGYLKTRPAQWSIAINKNISKSRFNIEYPSVIPYYTEPQVLNLGESNIVLNDAEVKIYSKERTICDCLKYQEKMDREDFKKGVLSYIMDDDKDIASLMTIARERKVLKKVQNIIGVWL